MNTKVKKLTSCGMFAAMIFVLTMYVKFPVASGYIHFGDALIYVCAIILGAPYAMAAGAIGAVLADIVGGYVMYAPATFIIKALITVPFIFVKNKDRINSAASRFMTLPAGVITIVGYFIADLLIDKAYAFADISTNAIQAGGSAVIFLVIAAALDKAKIKDRINFDN